MMNHRRRLPLVARLLTVGVIAGSILGSTATASAAPPPAGPPRYPDLTVGVTASPNPVAHAGTHTYKLTVTNITWASLSPFMAPRPVIGVSLSNVRVHLNAYPSNEQLVSFHDDSGAGFICYTPAEYFGMDVRCVSGTVPTLSTVQITLVMTAPSTVGTFTSTATVNPYSEISEGNESNNTATTSFTTN